jgi:hypothetical protein
MALILFIIGHNGDKHEMLLFMAPLNTSLYLWIRLGATSGPPLKTNLLLIISDQTAPTNEVSNPLNIHPSLPARRRFFNKAIYQSIQNVAFVSMTTDYFKSHNNRFFVIINSYVFILTNMDSWYCIRNSSF